MILPAELETVLFNFARIFYRNCVVLFGDDLILEHKRQYSKSAKPETNTQRNNHQANTSGKNRYFVSIVQTKFTLDVPF